MGAKLREVRRRIRSVQSTMKITRAMELIATSRILKAQQRVEAARPYADRLTAAITDVASASAALSHPLLEGERPVGQRGLPQRGVPEPDPERLLDRGDPGRQRRDRAQGSTSMTSRPA